MLIAGMGHAMPMPLWPEIIDAIAEHAHGASTKRDELRANCRRRLTQPLPQQTLGADKWFKGEQFFDDQPYVF
jgi:hypothetical protein